MQAAGFGDLAKGAVPAIVLRLREAAIPIRRVVDAGCGAGPLSRALTEAGFEVTGIDTSLELLDFARRTAPGARFVHGSIHEVELPRCEAIVALGEPLTYYGADVDAMLRLRDFFRRASAVLPAGGLLIFDIIEKGQPSLSARTWKAGEDWAVLVETCENQANDSLVRQIHTFRRIGDSYRRGCEAHHVKIFDTGVICDALIPWFRFGTDVCYGPHPLAPRRRAFFATKI